MSASLEGALKLLEEEPPQFEPCELEGPPPLPAANPAWLEPLQDASTEDEVYIWHKFVYGGMADLEPEPCGTDWVGGNPSWWREEDKSLDAIIGPPWLQTKYGGHDFTCTWTQFALAEGLAPGQPFLIRIDPPNVYRSSWEYNEWDCEWNFEIVRRQPRTQEQAGRAWDRFLRRAERFKILFCKRHTHWKHLQATDISAMSIRLENYGEWTDYRGVRIHLDTAHNSMWNRGWSAHPSYRHHLMLGDDDRGDFAKAAQNFKKNIEECYPALWPALRARIDQEWSRFRCK